MAKIKHNNILDTVDSVFSVARERGVLHLQAEDESLSGRTLTLQGREVLHFGTCGYLGLEHHPSVKQGAISAIERYGVQFSMSRTYVRNPLYRELDDLIRQMYGRPAVISKNCTLAHLATIPVLIRQSDLVVLDHQVHTSVQEAVKKLLSQGVTVEMVRHNNLEILEDILKKNRGRYDKVWYMADGVYSMYGDYAPIKEMIALAEKYEELYLYVDDAHGMSWAGANGTGYVMSQMDGFYRKMVLTANLGKAFGACGGLTLFPTEDMYERVNVFGGPLTFSVQLEPATLGAAIASAKIHLSDEIIFLQTELQQKIAHFNALLKMTDLPVVEENDSPIFFIGVGAMDIGNFLVRELINDGVYVNLATFPAVPAKNTGIRITISRNNTFEDIEVLVNRLVTHFHRALAVHGHSTEKIRKAFRMAGPAYSRDYTSLNSTASKPFLLRCHTSIKEIAPTLWDDHLGDRAMFDWGGLRLLEESFSGNAEPENNWEFRYYIAEDARGRVILMTFFIIALHKEDIFSRASVSAVLEKEREKNPYYLTAKGIFMGSLFTEGNHLYVDKTSSYWKPAMEALLEELYKEQERAGAGNIMFRDLPAGDVEMESFMVEHSFVKVDMPESCVVENLAWNTEEEYLQTLSHSARKSFKRYIKRFEQYCDVEIKSQLTEDELRHAIRLFRNVKERNLAINIFHFPDKLFYKMNLDPQWEFVTLTLKKELGETDKPVVVCFCHKNSSRVYSFMLTGIDYDYVYQYSVYRQGLYQIVKRANALGSKRANFGISATVEKKRVGARPLAMVGYFQAGDNYAMEMMETTIALKKD